MSVPSSHHQRSLAARTRRARYLVASSVVLAGVGWLLFGQPSVCREQIPDTGTTPVKVCGPPAVTDAQPLAVLLVGLVLLAPDLAEVGIGGVTLKRAVEEAKADAATARAEVASLRLGVAQMAEMSVGVTTNTTVDVADSAAELVRTLAEVGLLRGATEGDVVQLAGASSVSALQPPVRQVSDDARATLITVSMEGMLGLLPEEWQPGTLVAATGGLTYLAGAELDEGVLDWLHRQPGGAIADGLAGEATGANRSRSRPAVVGAPALGADGRVLGAVAVVLPRSVELLATSRDTAAALEPIAEAFAALAATLPPAPDGADGRARSAGGQS